MVGSAVSQLRVFAQAGVVFDNPGPMPVTLDGDCQERPVSTLRVRDSDCRMISRTAHCAVYQRFYIIVVSGYNSQDFSPPDRLSTIRHVRVFWPSESLTACAL